MSSNLNESMRANYEQYGVEQYYKLVGGKSNSYRNPHYAAVKLCLYTWLNHWAHHSIDSETVAPCLHLLDMAAGSGEATLSVNEWWQAGHSKFASSISPGSPIHPTPAGKAIHATTRKAVFIPPKAKVHNRLECEALLPPSSRLTIAATDPYTAEAYLERTGLPCSSLSFHDISLGQLPTNDDGDSKPFDMVICSFALHLIESPSEIWSLLTTLSRKAQWLIVLEPHKKPEIKPGWGWELWDVEAWCAADQWEVIPKEILRERVHCRVFRSTEQIILDDGPDVSE